MQIIMLLESIMEPALRIARVMLPLEHNIREVRAKHPKHNQEHHLETDQTTPQIHPHLMINKLETTILNQLIL